MLCCVLCSARLCYTMHCCSPNNRFEHILLCNRFILYNCSYQYIDTYRIYSPFCSLSPSFWSSRLLCVPRERVHCYVVRICVTFFGHYIAAKYIRDLNSASGHSNHLKQLTWVFASFSFPSIQCTVYIKSTANTNKLLTVASKRNDNVYNQNAH